MRYSLGVHKGRPVYTLPVPGGRAAYWGSDLVGVWQREGRNYISPSGEYTRRLSAAVMLWLRRSQS